MNKGLGRVALVTVLAVLALSAAGCTSRTGVANAGWTVTTASPDAVYAILSTGTVLSIDPEDGSVNWHYPLETAQPGGLGALFSRPDPNAPKALEATYGEPVVVGDTLLAASLDGKLRAFDRAKGTLLWEVELDGGIVGGMAAADGIAYLGTDAGLVYAVDLATQQFVWTEPFKTEGWVWGAPVVDATRVYVATMGRSVYALDRATGSQAWTFETTGAIPDGVTLADGVLYVGTVDRLVIAVDAATGQRVWERTVGHWVMGRPLELDGTVFVGALDGKVYALNATDGSDRWTPVSVDRAVRSGPVAMDGSIVVATESGELWRLDAANGERTRLYPEIGEIGQNTGLGAILSSPAVVDGWVVIGTDQGKLVALDVSASGATERWVYAAD